MEEEEEMVAIGGGVKRRRHRVACEESGEKVKADRTWRGGGLMPPKGSGLGRRNKNVTYLPSPKYQHKGERRGANSTFWQFGLRCNAMSSTISYAGEDNMSRQQFFAEEKGVTCQTH